MSPEVAETSHGITVDAGIAGHIDRLIDCGLTPRASCSGLTRDHPEDDKATPYLSIQAAPTLRRIPRSLSFPDDHQDDTFVARLEAAGEAAGWNTSLTKVWVIYPAVKFSLLPPRADTIHDMFGSDVAYSDLSDDQQTAVNEQWDEVKRDVASRPDAEVEDDWNQLVQELERVASDVDVPTFADEETYFNEKVEPFIQSIMPYDDDELIDFRTPTDS